MASSRNKSKSFGLRMLWIPGRKKNNPKGHIDTTNKRISYPMHQKKSEVWSLGGSRSQRELIYAEPDATLFDGPSVSGVKSLNCTVGALGIAECAQELETYTNKDAIITSEEGANIVDQNIPRGKPPETPTSSTSTTPLISLTQHSPVNDRMPAKTTTHTTTTTTTAEISDGNRYAILNKTLPEENNTYAETYDDANVLNSSAGTNESEATSASTSPKTSKPSSLSSNANSPTKKKHRNHNNNHQSDVNSIESLTDETKRPSADLDWVDEMMLDREAIDFFNKREHKHKKKKDKRHVSAKNLDQLDGVPSKNVDQLETKNLDQQDGASIKVNPSETSTEEENDKVITCLYYTLMCCECTIS